MLNAIQMAAYELIQSDARFFYTLIDIQQNAKNISSNYIMMSQPYIGLFTDGAEQWCKKAGLPAPQFSNSEKEYYTALRQSHKLYEMPYSDYSSTLLDKLTASENHFYKKRRFREKILGYYNVGTDLCDGEFCGNTILCALYMPVDTLNIKEIGPWIRDMSVVSGQLIAFFDCTKYPPFEYNNNISVGYKDFHFYENCPLKIRNDLGFILFSILCSINYSIEFIEKYFVDEIPQKFKFAYLQYYYLCDFINDLNSFNGTNYYINNSLKDRAFRNCLAHYGLGQYISETDLDPNDTLKGLTNKAFNLDYASAKTRLYQYLHELTLQIKTEIVLLPY